MSNTYFILTRQIFESAIWKHNPHVTRLFIYLIGMARYRKKPEKYPTFSIKRGELVTSLTFIADNNKYIDRGVLRSWSKQKVSRMLKTLEDEGYISLLSDTYGTHISVTNYDTYQSPERYKADGCGTGVEQVWNGCGTGVETNNKDNKVNNEKNGVLRAHSALRLVTRPTPHDIIRCTQFVMDYGLETVLTAIGVFGDCGYKSTNSLLKVIKGELPKQIKEDKPYKIELED